MIAGWRKVSCDAGATTTRFSGHCAESRPACRVRLPFPFLLLLLLCGRRPCQPSWNWRRRSRGRTILSGRRNGSMIAGWRKVSCDAGATTTRFSGHSCLPSPTPFPFPPPPPPLRKAPLPAFLELEEEEESWSRGRTILSGRRNGSMIAGWRKVSCDAGATTTRVRLPFPFLLLLLLCGRRPCQPSWNWRRRRKHSDEAVSQAGRDSRDDLGRGDVRYCQAGEMGA
jgi:hypothetical protein